ncbi:MAG TPA: GntR family transcriptional regulator [Pseudolabrys sp.]|nr:GntR family transcriptional regulator [Pseudolabrys sp.]
MNEYSLRGGAVSLTAQQMAYIHIQDKIVSGVLAGGSRIKSDDVAAELGVSRMPVREAIRQLDAEGYVTIRPNRGAVVTTRTREQVVELFEIRAILEGTALRFAAAKATASHVADLQLELQRLRNVECNTLEWVARHDDFHHRLCVLSGRPQLIAECRRYRLAVGPYVRLFVTNSDYNEQPGFEHDILIYALRDRDGERAEILMRCHIMANARAISEALPVSSTTQAA